MQHLLLLLQLNHDGEVGQRQSGSFEMESQSSEDKNGEQIFNDDDDYLECV